MRHPRATSPQSTLHPCKRLSRTGVCRNRWSFGKAPPDQQSRSPSPIIPLPTPVPAPRGLKVPSMVPQGNLKPTSKPAPTKADKGKGRLTGKGTQAKPPPTSAELVNDDDNETKPRNTLPSTLGMDKHEVKCDRCMHGGHGCHVHPNNATACFECNHWKVWCSRVKVSKTNADPDALLKEDADATPGPKKKTGGNHKKPTAIPAGEAGEYGGEFRLMIFSLSFFKVPFSIPNPCRHHRSTCRV